MYGMVNKAVRGFVLKNFDQKTWSRIHSAAGTEENFLSMQTYDDSVTYDLVGAAHAELGMPVPDILNNFGRYWVSDIATESYANLMAKTGGGFVEFVKNLDHMHERIRVTFPDYQPPSFRVLVVGKDSIQVDYYSHREGLLDFVEGLFQGLAEYYNETINITRLADDTHPMPCKRMLIDLRVP